MLVKACQCSPMECGTILLMQLSSAFFFHGNALKNVSLACSHQAGKNFVMEAETWPDYIFYNKTPKFTWTFQLASLTGGSSWIHLGFWTEDFDSVVLDIWGLLSLQIFWAALSFLFFGCDRKPLFLHNTLWLGCTHHDRFSVDSSWSRLINKPPALLLGFSHDWLKMGCNDNLALHWACMCDKNHNFFSEYRYITITWHAHLILKDTCKRGCIVPTLLLRKVRLEIQAQCYGQRSMWQIQDSVIVVNTALRTNVYVIVMEMGLVLGMWYGIAANDASFTLQGHLHLWSPVQDENTESLVQKAGKECH